MRRTTIITILSLFILSGCTSSGAFLSVNQTVVNLNEGNYTISATNVTGESEAAYVFGLSYSTGLTASTIALARIEGSGMLYTEALENLWENFETSGVSAEGQRLALTNVRYDADILNFIVYTKVKVTVRADVITFD
jgi:phosphoribosyl-AMP cyclohydrolase